jgi:hypothetical protein
MAGGISNSRTCAATGDFHRNVCCGSWLCENAKTLNPDRRTCSSKTVLVAQRASGFNFEIELKNIILRRVSIFEFLHSQGQKRRFGRPSATSDQPRSTDIDRLAGLVWFVPIIDIRVGV